MGKIDLGMVSANKSNGNKAGIYTKMDDALPITTGETLRDGINAIKTNEKIDRDTMALKFAVAFYLASLTEETEEPTE